MTLPPIPPTDSFYKFMAISGLIVLGLSFYIPWQMQLELRLAQLDISLELDKFEIEDRQIGNEIKEAEEDLRPLEEAYKEYQMEERTKGQESTEESREQALFLLSQAQYQRKRAEERQSRIQQQLLLHTQIKNSHEKAKFLSSRLDIVHTASRTAQVIGLVMMGFGFWNWYLKFQKYQDQIVKAQAAQWTKPNPKPDTSDRDEVPG